MRSNSFEIWTSNEVQGMLRYSIKSWKLQEIKSKKRFSGSFLEVFQLRLLLHPMSYALFFRKMTGLINIYNRGEFYEYSILDCQVISFLYWFGIHQMPLFGDILGPNFPKYSQILLKFSAQLVFKETKTVH